MFPIPATVRKMFVFWKYLNLLKSKLILRQLVSKKKYIWRVKQNGNKFAY